MDLNKWIDIHEAGQEDNGRHPSKREQYVKSQRGRKQQGRFGKHVTVDLLSSQRTERDSFERYRVPDCGRKCILYLEYNAKAEVKKQWLY